MYSRLELSTLPLHEEQSDEFDLASNLPPQQTLLPMQLHPSDSTMQRCTLALCTVADAIFSTD